MPDPLAWAVLVLVGVAALAGLTVAFYKIGGSWRGPAILWGAVLLWVLGIWAILSLAT